MFSSLPLTALRTFESAARLSSFKAAAEELAVTPTAVSHQIRGLESWLGVPLFHRLPRSVRLTDGGQRLFGSLHGALLEITQTLDQLRPQRSSGNLTLSTTPAFAALWLIPRLGRFYAEHPEISVRLDTSNTLIDLHQDAWGATLAARPGEVCGPGTSPAFGWDGAPGWATRVPDTQRRCIPNGAQRELAPAVVNAIRSMGLDVTAIPAVPESIREAACASS